MGQRVGEVTRVARAARASVFALAAAMLLCAAVAAAQSANPPVALPGNVVVGALPLTDQGAINPSTQLSLSLVLTPSATTQAALTTLLTAQQTVGAPEYHHWLTPAMFAGKYGVDAGSVSAAVTWLQSQGLTVGAVGAAGEWVQFTGSAAQVEAAFGVSIDNFTGAGIAGYANTNAPSVPQSLSGFVVGVAGLTRLVPQVPANVLEQATYSSTGWMSPSIFATQYDVAPLQSATSNGAGVTIAVAGAEPISNADIAAYRSVAGLPALTVAANGAAPAVSSTGVATAELELAGSEAPAAGLSYYAAASELLAAQNAVDANTATVLLLGGGGCEAAYPAAEITAYQQMSDQAAAEGMTVVTAAGDGGPAACNAGQSVATLGAAVDFPASLPMVTAVGGTSIASGSETAWSTGSGVNAGGGGASSVFTKPTWQTGTANDAARDLPDIALAADALYPVCVQGACASGFAGSNGDAWALTGTTAAAASYAGVAAMLAEADGGSAVRLGDFAPMIYTMSSAAPASASASSASGVHANAVPSGGSAVRDVTTGTDAVPETSGTLAYTATSGYDLATGLGAIDAAVVAKSIPRPLAAVSTSTMLQLSPNPVTYDNAVTATASVTPGTATGQVTLVDNSTGQTLGQLNLDASGVAQFTIAAGTLASGNHNLEAEYAGDTNDLASDGFATSVVNQITTTTGTSFSPTSPVTQGTQETITATVSPASATGNVVFTDSIAGNLGTVALSGGVASVITSTLAPGNHNVTTAFQGSTNYVASNSSSTLVVGQNTTTTSVSETSSNISYGTQETITATVSPTTATGTVTFTDTSTNTALGTISMTNGVATLQTSTLAVGQHNITAAYNGDTNDSASSGSTTITVAQKSTTTTVAVSSYSITYGGSVTITATVNDATATGTVTFSYTSANGSGTLGTATVTGGVASLTTTALPAGSVTITAAYGGTASDGSSSGTSNAVTVAQRTTTTTLTPSTYSTSQGTNVTLTATISPVGASGTVTFSATNGTSTVQLGTAAVNTTTGVAQLSTTALPTGTTVTVTAAYGGDTNDAASNGTNTLYVAPKASTVTVTITPQSTTFGNTVTIAATVSTNVNATGTMTFTDSGGATLATGTVTAGTATITTSALAVGAHTITAAYSGDANDSTATGTGTVTITKGASQTVLTVSPSPAIVNFPTTFTATITNAGTGTGPYSFTGTVSFYNGTTLLGSATVTNNVATFSYTFTGVGNESIYAVYSGDTNWNGSTSNTVTLVVEGVPSTVTLTTSTGTVLAGANVIFTVTVGANSAYSAEVTTYPTGEVTFYDEYNGSFTVLGSSSLVQSGFYISSATFQSKFFLPGIHQITAIYNGNSYFGEATSAVFDLTVQDFTITASPSTGSVTRGSSTSTQITIGSLYGFSGTVNLSCTPPGGTYTGCSLSNTTIVGSGVTTLYIATNVSSAQNDPGAHGQTGSGEQSKNSGGRGVALGAVGLALMIGLVRPRRWKFGRLAVVLLAAAALGCAAIGFAGCGSQVTNTTGSVTGTAAVTPQGVQTFTVLASGTNGITTVNHTLSFQVNVQ